MNRSSAKKYMNYTNIVCVLYNAFTKKEIIKMSIAKTTSN